MATKVIVQAINARNTPSAFFMVWLHIVGI
jgi:hypothetical protein